MTRLPWLISLVLLVLLASAQTAAALPAPAMMPGWPQTMGTHSIYKPTGVVLADVDNDGFCEVLAGSTDNSFRVWNYSGVLLPGWPVNVGSRIQCKAAVADLDGDGDQEIAFAVSAGQLRIYHHTGVAMSGWPKSVTGIYGYMSPTIYDLDGDGHLEVMIGAGANVYAWHADGTAIPGFPRSTGGSNVTGTLAVGDLDGDGAPEIMAVTLNGTLCAFHRDGTVVAGWPQVFGFSTSYAAPSLGDVDNDGLREVFVVAYEFTVRTLIYGYRGDGTLLPGFPIVYPAIQTYSCPVLADADGDGDLEIFNAGHQNAARTIYGFDHTGALLPGWPVPGDGNSECSPIIVDFNGDARKELAIGDNFGGGVGTIYGYHLDGTVASPDFPMTKSGSAGPNAPEVADVDRDGDLDMAMTMMDGNVALWSFTTTPWSESRVQWGGWFHDNWNTNQYGFRPLNPAAVAEGGERLPLLLEPARPNPFSGRTSIHFVAERGGWMSLEVYDLSGRRVQVLHQGALSAGSHSVTWDGAAENGLPAPAGVYFLRLCDQRGVQARSAVCLIR
jgi:hypothetical protein